MHGAGGHYGKKTPLQKILKNLENPSAEGVPVWDSEDPAAQRAAAVKRDQQQADALVDLSREYLAGGTGRKTSTADHYQVLVHVDEAALRGQPNADSKSDLPIETVRRLCCDGAVVVVTESKESSGANVRVSAEAPDKANTSADAFEVSPATSADDAPVGSTVDSQDKTLTDLACNPSRDAFGLAPATSADDTAADSNLNSPNGKLADLAGDPSRDAFAVSPATSADDTAAGSTADSPNGKLADLAGDPSRDAFALAPAVSSNGSTGVMPAVTPVDSHNGALTDLVDDPSRDALVFSPATSADDAPAGLTVDSQDSTLTDLVDDPSRDAFAVPPAIGPNATAGRPRLSLNLSRKHRLVPCARRVQPALRRALEARDRGCRFPGCSHERWLDAHHVVHWADGGETSLGNTLLLCSRHHRLLHEGGFAIRADANGEWQFQNAKGMKQPQSGY